MDLRKALSRGFPVIFALSCAIGLVWWINHARRGRDNAIRNVVLISIDTCRADYLSCYGERSRATTPHIDAIADQGVLFSRAQSTNPQTLPAHCSMLTGTTPLYHSVHLNFDRLRDESNVTLAEVLRENDIQTGAILGAFPLDKRFGLSQGFDSYDAHFEKGGRNTSMDQRSASDVSRRAREWLGDRKDEPFFLFLHFFDPHAPYAPPPPYFTEYEDDRYAGEIAYTDLCVGEITDELKKLGLTDSTLIIITSDHGESLGEHGEDTHAFFAYQSTIRVPLIFAGPGLAMGHRVDDAVGHIDIMPTVLNLLDLPVPAQVQGVNLSEYLWGDSDIDEKRVLYSESWFPAKFGCFPPRGLVQDNWHYIWSVRPELYDLNDDPAEANNLHGTQPDTADRLHKRLEELLARHARNEQPRAVAANGDDTNQRLQSLGYVGGGLSSDDLDPLANVEDAKDFIGVYQDYNKAVGARANQRFDIAETLCLRILARRPDTLHVRLLLGHIASDKGRDAEAAEHFSRVIDLAAKATNPRALNFEVFQAYNNLAWLFATSNNPLYRSPKQALQHARRANELSGGGNADVLDTLAVAYAATGNFEQAVTTAEQALVAYGNESKSAEQIRIRLELFKQAKPYRKATQ